MITSTTYKNRYTNVDLTPVKTWLSRHSITVLRISLGVVFLGFGVLKFFPGASPAEDLAIRTVDALTLGIVSGGPALWLTAAVECFIGMTLVSGRWLRAGLATLGLALIGILSPLVLFFGDLFPGAPTLEAQYVLKDVVLAASGLVIGASALGARLR
jgi:putative oxidoreductase